MTYQQMSDSYVTIADSMKFIQFNPPQIIIDDSIRASIYFMRKAIECLQFARFFTMKAALLLDIDYNIKWSQGYFPQFLFRCIYFGTATTWYSNAFDHVLQAVYWGEKLYTYNKKIYLIIYDSTAGTSTLKLVEKFKEKGIPILSIEDLESYMKIKNCKIIAIKNKDISEILYNNAKF